MDQGEVLEEVQLRLALELGVTATPSTARRIDLGGRLLRVGALVAATVYVVALIQLAQIDTSASPAENTTLLVWA